MSAGASLESSGATREEREMLLEGKMQRSSGGRPLPVSTHASRSVSLTSMSASAALQPQ